MLLLPELPEMKDQTEEAVCAVEDGFIHKTVRGGVMKNGMWILLLVTILLLKNGATDAQPPDFLWAAQAGGAAHSDIAYAIATDSSDNSIVTGCFYDTATFGDTTLVSAGSYDIFIATYDGAGELLWVAQEGGTYNDNASSIVIDRWGSFILTGGFYGSTSTIGDSTFVSVGSGDIFVAKYDEDGDFLWAAQAGGAGVADNIHGVATDDSGNVIVTGSFSGTATFGDTALSSEGSLDIFVAKYDSGGNFLWAARAGGTDIDEGRSIATDESGNSMVTGRFVGTASFGDTTLVAAGYRDVFIAKYDRAGGLLWVVQAGGTADTWGYGIATDGSGNSIVTGELRDTATFGDTTLVSAGGYDIFIAKCDNAGNFLWAAQAGGTRDDHGWGITTDDSGNVIVTGYFGSQPATFGDTTLTSEGSFDIFIAKYDSAGDFLWAAQAGGISEDGGFGVTTDDSGNPVVTGYFSYTATFGDTTLTSAGEYDIFVAKLGAGGTRIEGEFVRPRSFELLQNRPNPFNSATLLRFRTAESGMVNLKIYDVSGREVRTLVDGWRQPGSHTVLWDGRSDVGVQASSGVYFYRLQAGSWVETRKMLLLR
jgi:hypothetical protein